jgi:LPS sulfotransferase NodH
VGTDVTAAAERLSRSDLLHLLSSYLPNGPSLLEEIRHQLPGSRQGGFRVPEKILIILFASRAGSNYLGQLLTSTGWFGEIGESFRPHQLIRVGDRHGLEDAHAAAQWMIDHRGTEHAFGIKAGFDALISAATLGFLPQVLDRTQFVLLRRRDRVAQAISRVKGKLSGRMHSGQPTGRSLTDSDYDADAVVAHVQRILEREGQYEAIVRRLGKAAPVIYYEDVCADPAAQVARICNPMGLHMPDRYEPKVRVKILRNDLSTRWADRFRREHPGVS